MNTEAPDALLLIAPGCPHCASVLGSLAELVKQGQLGRLEIINIAIHPEAARKAATRSVPWMRIGPFELSGNYTRGELLQWVERATAEDAADAYIRELLEQQQLERAIDYLKRHPEQLAALPRLMEAESPSLSVRFGIGAILESLAESGDLAPLVPSLIRLAGHEKANLRADAAHYLGLSGAPEAIPVLKRLLQDDHPDVREIAADSL